MSDEPDDDSLVLRRHLVMQHENRLTVKEAGMLLKALEPYRAMTPDLGSAYRKIEYACEHARRREKKFFGPGATAAAPPPLKLVGGNLDTPA